MAKQIISGNDLRLTVEVKVRKQSGKVRFVTDIRIKLGPLTVAIGTIGGRATAEQALREYRKAPARFLKGPGHSTAAAIGLVA